MSKRIYISGDYANEDGDREVVDQLNEWALDNYFVLDFVDMAKVVSESVSNNPDCRICELKEEFNSQINASSIVVFVVGNKTKDRTAGSMCGKVTNDNIGLCTPYKQNTNGSKSCNNFKYYDGSDVNPVNSHSFLRHEFEQAKKKGKRIVIFYDSIQEQISWLPSYMMGFENFAIPFWCYDDKNNRKPDYYSIKKALGYE